MPYTRRNWQNAPSSATPLNAAALNNIEDGVEAAYDAVTGRLSEQNLDATIVSLIDEVGGGMLHTQSTPSASWVIAHSFARVPNVGIYVAGELVETDVAATSTTVTVTFPTPTAGLAVLN